MCSPQCDCNPRHTYNCLAHSSALSLQSSPEINVDCCPSKTSRSSTLSQPHTLALVALLSAAVLMLINACRSAVIRVPDHR